MLIHNNGWFHPNFSPDGVAGGGSEAGSSSEQTENAESSKESSPSDVKQDVSKEIPAHDEKGVPYYNRYREMEEKFKGVDLDKWKELSGIDLGIYKSEREWLDMLMGEKELYNQVLNMIKGYKKPAPQQTKSTENPELVDVRKKLEELESWKTATEQEKEELIAEQVRTEYDSRYNKELEVALKSKNIQSLTAVEKQWLRDSVDNEYRKDWENSQANKTKPALGWNELPKIVKKYTDAVDSSRRESLKGSVRKDGSPDAIHGGGPTQFQRKPGAESKAQRVSRIANELKESLEVKP